MKSISRKPDTILQSSVSVKPPHFVNDQQRAVRNSGECENMSRGFYRDHSGAQSWIAIFLVFPLQVHRHAHRIGLRMALRSDHILVEADGHDRTIEGNMWTFFFKGENRTAHFLQFLLIGVKNLEIATVNRIERIIQSLKYGFSLTTFQ